jgi:hypothetical protein
MFQSPCESGFFQAQIRNHRRPLAPTLAPASHKPSALTPVAALAAALLGLSAADRARLAALLLADQTEGQQGR